MPEGTVLKLTIPAGPVTEVVPAIDNPYPLVVDNFNADVLPALPPMLKLPNSNVLPVLLLKLLSKTVAVPLTLRLFKAFAPLPTRIVCPPLAVPSDSSERVVMPV